MGLGKNVRVNMVITNRVLRYTFHQNSTLDSLTSHGEIELPEGTISDGNIMNKPVLIELINKLVHTEKWKRKKLYFCVPDNTVVIREMAVPATLSKNEIKGYLNTQIGNSLHLPFDNPAIDFEMLDAVKEQQNILLFAYPEDRLHAFNGVFIEAGLKPEVADLTSLSVYRYYYVQSESKEEDVLLIHWNTDSIALTAFNQHKAIFTRYRKVEVPKEMLDEQMANQMVNEQIIEVNRIIDFYQYNIRNNKSSITKILISGDFPYLKQVKNKLMDKVIISVSLVDEINKAQEIPAKYTDVLGLALKRGVLKGSN